MPALTATTFTKRRVLGDLVQRTYSLSGTNGDTFTPPQQGIESYYFTPTTAISVGMTLLNGVLTFVTGGAFAGILTVDSREG